MKNRLREELEAMLELRTGDSFTADNVHTLVNGIFAADEGGGGFVFVEYDNNAFPYPQEIGKTADSIEGLGNADENMLKTIFIMPNKSTNPDATLMIVVDEKEPSTDPKTYQYVYVGNINDLPSDVLTESSIVNDLISGGTDKPLSAEQGRTLNSHVNYTTCGSGASDEVKLISDDGFELSTHLRLLVKMNNTNTNSTPKFNINGTGIKDVWYNGSVASDTNTWSAGEVLDVYYDGTKYIATTYGGAQFSTGEKVGDVGIDDEPTAGSDNLVKSGGIYNELNILGQDISNLEDTQEQLLIVTHGIEITKSDFSLDGVYSSTSMTISPNANYKSTPIYDVNPGDIFVWSNFPTVSTVVYALSMYDEDGEPVVPSGYPNNRVRADENNLSEGFAIPSGVKKVGFMWNNGQFPLTEQSKITSGEDNIELTQEAKNLLNEELGLNEISGDVQDAKEKSEEAKNEVELIIEQIPETKKIPSDFTTTGIWKTSVAEIDSSYSNYRAVALLDVVGGQVITWHKWQNGGSIMNSVAAIFCYDNDGLPYNGVSARINYDGLTTYNLDTGEFTFKIPSNCSQIGLAYNFTAYSVQEGAEIIISEESVELTELAKELINNAVEQSDEVGSDTSKYYLKGNSNIVYSPAKKLGIIAAGQSNIDGRNSYSDYPYLSVNPNPKVHFKNSKNGAFSSFEITDGGQNNDWSFDAIVYNLLTDSSYGNLSDIYVMKKSMGGTSIDPMGATDYHWTADYEFLTSESASLLRGFEEIVRAGISSDGSNFDIKAMLWHQGEGDMQNEQVANRYYENLKNMLAYVRGIVGNPRLYFFCGNISLNRTSPGYINIINAAYTKIASEDPYFKVVDMSNAQLEDGYHFNYQWSIYFGQKVYDLMIDAGIITGTKINPVEPS